MPSAFYGTRSVPATLESTSSLHAVAVAELFAESGDLGFGGPPRCHFGLQRFLGGKESFARVQPVEHQLRALGLQPQPKLLADEGPLSVGDEQLVLLAYQPMALQRRVLGSPAWDRRGNTRPRAIDDTTPAW